MRLGIDRWRVPVGRRVLLPILSGGAAVSGVLLLYVAIGRDPGPIAATPEQSAAPTFHQHAPASLPSADSAPSRPSSASPAGLTLHGVLGAGAAVIGFPDGGQRAVPVGREFLPGLTLKAVALHHVLIATGAGDVRLEFKKATGHAERRSGALGHSSAASREDENQARETLEYRTGLMPVQEGGRTRGFAVRPGADLATFQKAGLRPGDVIVSVNGQAFRSEEKVMELSQELASARKVEIDFLRNGRRMTGIIELPAL